MTTALVFRTATPDDLPSITRIYAHAVDHGTATYELEAPDEKEMLARMQSLVGQGYPYLVALQGEDVLGYAYAGPFRARPAYRFMVEDSVYLAPEAQGKGVGRRLLGALIEACRASGFRQIVAVIGDGTNHRASVGVHAALGFEHAGVLKGSGYKFERWLDTVFMQLELNGGTGTPPDPASVPEKMYRKSAS